MGKFYEGCAGALELWVRQYCWLNTAPEVERKGKGKKPEPLTRIKAMKAQDKPVRLPDSPAPYLTDWLFEIGPASATGMGDAPLSWQEMEAWQELTGIELDAWEARTLRRLSRAFIDQRHEAKKADCPEPFGPTRIAPDDRERVELQFKAMVAAFGGRKPGANQAR